MWSTAYHSSSYIAMFCSAVVASLAAVKGRVGVFDYSVWVAILSTVAALLTAISTFGGFARKWRANRSTRTELEALLIDLSASGADVSAIRDRFKEIIRKHDIGIQGEGAV